MGLLLDKEQICHVVSSATFKPLLVSMNGTCDTGFRRFNREQVEEDTGLFRLRSH